MRTNMACFGSPALKEYLVLGRVISHRSGRKIHLEFKITALNETQARDLATYIDLGVDYSGFCTYSVQCLGGLEYHKNE